MIMDITWTYLDCIAVLDIQRLAPAVVLKDMHLAFAE
jgi:hypothetical protein